MAQPTAEQYLEAITPTDETKAEYMNEFRIDFPMFDENGEESIQPVNVPWVTIKEIMVAIRTRAEKSAS